MDRLEHFRKETGVNSFKFDYGELVWYGSNGSNFQLHDHKVREYANSITSRYVEAVAKLGPMIEVRSAFKTQPQPIFVRMMDKESDWTANDGIKTLIPTALTMSLAGYSFILPGKRLLDDKF